MENKLNKQALENYARSVARKLCSDFFNLQKLNISGSEILKFSPIPQINYFILKNIFFIWKVEISQLKQSSYFNYDDVQVQDAIQSLMNVLSNHIFVKREAFENLLASSIEETLYLSLSPYHYFKQYFFTPDIQKISLADLQEKAKYLKVNQAFFGHFIEKLETYKVPVFYTTDIMGYFQDSYYKSNDTFDDFQPIINQVSLTIPFPMESIVSDLKKKDDYAPTPLELHQKDLTSKSKPNENAQRFGEMVTKPIKLGLNQRIMFTKELFKGNSELLEHTLARLETAGNWGNAKHILDFNKWDTESEVVQELYDLVELKYK
ncbi:MAG: hypothetical protein ACKVOU_03220 [Cytophagales bacterium]